MVLNVLPSIPFLSPPPVKDRKFFVAFSDMGLIYLVVYAEALTLARDLRSSNRRCFLRRRTLKRSKSVRAFLRWFCSRFLAQLDSFHLASISDLVHSCFRVLWRLPRFRPSTLRWERRALERGMAWRMVASSGSSEGPSARTCKFSQLQFLPIAVRPIKIVKRKNVHAYGR